MKTLLRVTHINYRSIILFVLLVLLHVTARAQLQADFTSSISRGCTPVLVTFRDLSTGNPVSWQWDLGNGTTSTQRNPSTAYFTPGSYNITLTITDASGTTSTVTKTSFIQVYAQPSVEFDASPSSGCVPLTVNFTDKTAAGSGTVTQWSWDFGDGTIDSIPNPTHTYSLNANFSVTLVATNSFGCTQLLVKPYYIQVSDTVTADFSYTYTNVCKPPATFQFTNLSQGGTGLTYQWFFGDGKQTNSRTPSHTYNDPGKYDVTLITTNSGGCSDTMVRSIAVGNYIADFNVPPSGCINSDVYIEDASSPIPLKSTWLFDDGTTDTGLTLLHTFDTAGKHKIIHYLNFGDCRDTVEKTIDIVNKPTASFNASSERSSCLPPLTVKFNNNSTAADAYLWYFGDGSTSTDPNPSHTYTTQGAFTVTLIASNGAGGCGDTIVQTDYVRILPPVITGFANFPYRTCLNSDVPFNAIIDSTEPIKSYLWSFGDGTTSTSPAPVHQYSETGFYTVSLTVTSRSGCTSTFSLDSAVVISKSPNAKFSAIPRDACASQYIQFTDRSNSTADTWEWRFGDGTISFDQNPQHKYIDSGYFNVTLYASNRGCVDSFTIPRYIHITSPVAEFVVTSDCTNRLTKTFKDRSIAPLTWNWDFGDGTTATGKTQTHKYDSFGVYYATLIVTNNTGCADTITNAVYVLNENPKFTVKALNTNFCKYDSIQFTATNYNPVYVKKLRWEFGDGSTLSDTSIEPIAIHVYDTAGTYEAKLITTDLNNCRDTALSKVLNIYGPTASFGNAGGTCQDTALKFTDSSFTDGIHPITKWIWNYGDGNIDTLTAPPFSHAYSATGTYNVTLTLLDGNSCTDVSQPDTITITKPLADFSAFDTLSCTASDIGFTNLSSGFDLSYLWNFGDGQSSNLDNTSHSYSNEGVYTVGLTITDTFGCKNVMVKPNLITVANPVASFTATYDTAATCPPLVVQMQNNSLNYASVLWDFGDGNISNETNPIHSYTLPGTYSITLRVQGYGDCYDDTIKQIVNLKGPYGTFKFSPLLSCFPQTISFTATAENTKYYIWDFNDGTTQTTSSNTISYQYKGPGSYIPKLIVQDAAGCQVPLTATDTVKIAGVDPKFTADVTTGCDSSLVTFTDSSIVANFDGVVSRAWDFGDGTASTDISPLHYYKKPGTYNVTLSIQTDSGCVRKYNLSVTVDVNKTPQLSATIPDSVCVNSQIDFATREVGGITDTLEWVWNLGNNVMLNSQNASYTYTIPGTYNVSIIATSPVGCADTVEKALTILALPSINAGIDSVLCLNQSIALQASGASSFVWENASSLSCLNCASPVANPDSTTTYFVTGTDVYGCVATDSILIKVIQPTVLNFISSDTLCLGTSLRLNVTGADEYTWQPTTGLDNSSTGSPLASPATLGINTYTVTGTDYKQCFADTGTISLLVAPLPTFNITDTAITMNVGSSYKIKTTNSADVVSWLWLPPYGLSCDNCAEPIAQPKSNITYNGKAFTQFGCTASDNIRFEVVCNNSNVFIPNTFSPNNDSRNDYFYPQGKGLFTIKSLRIFNRWGVLVFAKTNFTANNAADGWNGKYNGVDQPSDVYVYVCDVLCDNGAVLSYKGNITLIR